MAREPRVSETRTTTEDEPDESDSPGAVHIGAPQAEDGAEVHDLIAACPPLDTNSLYANLIQCSHFARTCALARSKDGAAIGWISGHIIPGETDTFFLWQVAVHEQGRGQRLAHRMLADIFARRECEAVTRMKTTITRDNDASWGLFRSIARGLDAPLGESEGFDEQRHFKGRHASEVLVTIGPFDPAARLGALRGAH
jgi:L-2,4-diaminobutyric acid acetyltransferase